MDLDTNTQAHVVGHPPLLAGFNMLSQFESQALSDVTERDNKSGCTRWNAAGGKTQL